MGDALLVGLLSAVVALVSYQLYDGFKKRYLLFRQKDFRQLAQKLKFSPEAQAMLWSTYRTKLRPLTTVNKKEEDAPADGLMIMGATRETFQKIRLSLPKEYQVFASGIESKGQRNLGIIKSNDEMMILKNMQTNGEGYKVTNGRLINDLKVIRNSYPFHIVGAGGDWMELEFFSLPEDLTPLLEKVQINLVPEENKQEQLGKITEELQKSHRLFLWWPRHDEA